MEKRFGLVQNPSSLFNFGESTRSTLPNNSSNAPSNEISASLSQISLAGEHADPIEDSSICEAVNKINTDDPVLQLEGLQLLRKELCDEDNAPINEIIYSRVCERILDLALNKSDDKFLLEVAWIFSNISSGNDKQTSYLVNLNVIPFLFSLLEKNNDEINEQVIWAFANISGGCLEWRDIIIEDEKFDSIIDLYDNANFSNRNVIKTYAWAISNFLRGQPQSIEGKVAHFAPFLVRIITEFEDQGKILVDAIWGCLRITELDPNVEILQKEPFLEKLIKLLSSKKVDLLSATLKTLGNITSEMENSYIKLFRLGFLPKIESLICHQKRAIKKEALWILSNIVTESNEVIAKFLEHKIYENLFTIIKKDPEDVKKEALWIISNSVFSCDENQIINLVRLGMIIEFTDCIQYNSCREITFEGLYLLAKKFPTVINGGERDKLIEKIDLVFECGEEYENATNLKELLVNSRINNQNN